MFEEHIETIYKTMESETSNINTFINDIYNTSKNKKKVIIFGNGGSSSDASHFAGELVGRYKSNRRTLPALSLSSDSAVITCIANDFGYDHIFSRQIISLANSGDLLIGISTSGTSKNVLKAFSCGKSLGINSWLLTGNNHQVGATDANYEIRVQSKKTKIIQYFIANMLMQELLQL